MSASGIASAAPALRFEGFELGFPTPSGTRLLVDEVSLELPPGELVVVLGPSGSGKSTLIAALLGFDDPYHPRTVRRGKLELLGTAVHGPLPSALQRRVGVLFQDGALVDELSPAANVALAVRESGGPRGDERRLLELVGLGHPPTSVASLSGGQRKRVALARALARDPELLVLDEPTAGLDPPGASEIARVIRQVHDAGSPSRTTLVVTHDLEAFGPVLERALFLDPARGCLDVVAPADLPATLERAERQARQPSGPPAVVPVSTRDLVLRWGSRSLLALADIGRLAGQAVRHLVPYHLGMLGRALVDQVLGPALYLALAAATTGALATCFALRNNPLEGAFQREVLMGNGKVLVSTALPLIVCVLFAARTSAGAAARIGSLRRSQVFEALPLSGVSPYAFLLTPLLISCSVAALVLTAVGIVTGCLAGLGVTLALTAISPFGWASASFAVVDGTDLRWVLLKSVGAGAITALTAFCLAARPKGSARDVADATNGAIVWSTLWVLLLHGGLTLVQFWR